MANDPETASKAASPVEPKQLLKVLSLKYEQFGLYEQQDAHELLRLLLDAMRMEQLNVSVRKSDQNFKAKTTATIAASLPNLRAYEGFCCIFSHTSSESSSRTHPPVRP